MRRPITAALWQALSELGLFHAFLPEDRGGIGGSGFDVLAVFEPLGRALCPEPMLGQLMALRLLPEPEAALAGTEIWALATGEPEAPWDIADTRTVAQETAAGWRLTGAKSLVYGGPAAAHLLIPARIGGDLALFAIEAGNGQGYALIDGGGASELRFDETPAQLVLLDAGGALEDALDWGRLALCAEALGAMEAGFALLVDYLKTRKQFGRPLAGFQALQHRAVDLKLELEQARSITIRAANAMGTDGQSQGGGAGQGAGRPDRASDRAGDDPDAGRDCHDLGLPGLAYRQTPDHDRCPIGGCKPPPLRPGPLTRYAKASAKG